MRFAKLLTALFVGSTGAALIARDVNTILNDFRTITTQTAKVKQDIDAFQGGPLSAPQALAIKADSDTLDNTIKSSTADANREAVFNDADSVLIANAVTALQANIFAVLDALVAKRAGFNDAVLGFPATGIVRDTVATLKRDTAAFGDALTRKLSPTIRRVAPLVTSNIDFHFERAVEAFGG